jgi:hypothetical protein
MAQTYTPIASQTVSGSSTASINFTSIPATYTDLVVVLTGTIAGGNDVVFQINGDTASNYSFTRVFGSGSTAYSDRTANSSNIPATIGGHIPGLSTISFNSYANTSIYRSALIRANVPSAWTGVIVGSWRNTTTAINRLYFYGTSAGNFADGYTITIYGVKAA